MKTEVRFSGMLDAVPCLHCGYGPTSGDYALGQLSSFFGEDETLRPVGDVPGIESLLFTALVPGIVFRTGHGPRQIADAVRNKLGAGFKIVLIDAVRGKYLSDSDTYLFGNCIIDFVRTK